MNGIMRRIVTGAETGREKEEVKAVGYAMCGRFSYYKVTMTIIIKLSWMLLSYAMRQASIIIIVIMDIPPGFCSSLSIFSSNHLYLSLSCRRHHHHRRVCVDLII